MKTIFNPFIHRAKEKRVSSPLDDRFVHAPPFGNTSSASYTFWNWSLFWFIQEW